MLIVFDLDGTLIDGYAGITDALGFAMERLGFAPLSEETVRGMVGEGLEKLLEKAVGAVHAREGVRLFRERYAVVADEKTFLLPDVPEVVERLAHDGHLLAVASNKPERFSRRILAGKYVSGARRSREKVRPACEAPRIVGCEHRVVVSRDRAFANFASRTAELRSQLVLPRAFVHDV